MYKTQSILSCTSTNRYVSCFGLFIFHCVCYNILDVEAQKRNATNSCDFSSSSSPGQSWDVICQPVMEFGKTMSDLTEILEGADHALKRMLVAFEHMAHYMKSGTYIAIVQSKEYKAVNSVRALFQLLAPHCSPVDISLLKALVYSADNEKAEQRLEQYLHMSNGLQLGSGCEKVHTPHEGNKKALVPSDSSCDAELVADVDSTSVPVIINIAADEMSWGAFRRIRNLLCGIFTVSSFALQYDDKNPGTLAITCTTSKEMQSHILHTLLDDGVVRLLHCEKIVSIQVGKLNYLTVSDQLFCIVR